LFNKNEKTTEDTESNPVYSVVSVYIKTF